MSDLAALEISSSVLVDVDLIVVLEKIQSLLRARVKKVLVIGCQAY